jgi:ABC-type transporter Mla subunit MlaD
MPPAKKSPARPTARPKASATTRARHEKNHRAISRIAKSLDTAQKDLAAIGGNLGTGAVDLRKDVAKRLRDASRDVTKLSNTVRRDLERLQKDLSAASKAKPRRARPATSRAKSGSGSRTRRKKSA